MHKWPLNTDDHITCLRSTEKSNWQMQDGFGNKNGFYSPIVRRLKQELSAPWNNFDEGCRKCQATANSWLHLWYDDLKCIHFELDVRRRRDARAGSVLIGVHVEENPWLHQRLANCLSEYVAGIEDQGQLYNQRINVDALNEINALRVVQEMSHMICQWVPRLCGAMQRL